MKIILYVLFFVFCTLFVNCSDINKTVEEKERDLIVKCKIKSITEYMTVIHLGIEEDEIVSREKNFNEKGLIIKEKNFSSKGNVECINFYEYDNNDNLILKTGLNEDSSLLFKEARTFDVKNNRKELYFYLPDGTYKYRNIAVYDDEGRMIKLDWYWPTGFKARNLYKYDDFKKIEDVEYDPEGKFLYKWVYSYNEKGNLIGAVQYYPNSFLNCKIIYEYNIFNMLSKQINYFRESVQGVTTFNYDKNNLLKVKTEYSSTGRVTAKYRYKYEYF